MNARRDALRFGAEALLMISSHSSRPELSCIKQNVHTANENADNGQKGCRDVWVDKLVEIMKQEAAPVGLDSRFCLEPVLEQC